MAFLETVLGYSRDRTRDILVVDWGFTTLLTSQVISVAFYSEREKSDKFCSEALISVWGSFTCRKSTTALLPFRRKSYSGFLRSEKNPSTPAGFEPANLGSSSVYDNRGTTGVDFLKRPLDGQYFCTIFEVAQWYWTFVGTIERLCNAVDGIKTFWNIGNIVSSVGGIAQYTIISFVSFFVLVPFSRLWEQNVKKEHLLLNV